MEIMQHRENTIIFLMEEYRDAITDDLDIYIKKSALKQYYHFLDKQQYMKDFYSYLKLKYQIRDAYLKLTSIKSCVPWASGYSSKLLLNEDRKIQSFYARTSKSNQQINIENNFIKEFLGKVNGPENLLYITNSGMSAINLALNLCHYCNKTGAVFVQKDSYYETHALFKSIFAKFSIVNIEKIYSSLRTDLEISCIFVGYTRRYLGEGSLSIKDLIESISQHKQKSIMFVIIDRTFFSLEDNFYEYLKDFCFPANIVIISVESLLKHYQYGLDIANLGAFFVYSNMCRKKYFVEVVRMLYDALSCRPAISHLGQMFIFNKDILQTQFNFQRKNLSIFQHINREFSVIPIAMKNPSKKEVADICYIPVDNIELGDNIVSEVALNKEIVPGQSFGFDLTRVCCETDFFTQKVFLRISAGTEDEDEMKRKSYYIRDTLRRYL